jgi:hypothetical protein
MIDTLTKGSRVFHAEHGVGTVTLREKQAVGITYDSGSIGGYGSAYFDRFPDMIIKRCGVCSRRLDVKDEPQSLDCGGDCRGCVMAAEEGLSIEDRMHLDVTGHLPEDF